MCRSVFGKRRGRRPGRNTGYRPVIRIEDDISAGMTEKAAEGKSVDG